MTGKTGKYQIAKLVITVILYVFTQEKQNSHQSAYKTQFRIYFKFFPSVVVGVKNDMLC